MVVIVCVEIFDAYRRTYKVPYDRAWTDFKKEQKNKYILVKIFKNTKKSEKINERSSA